MPGEYKLAMSEETREPIMIEAPVELTEPSVIEEAYRSHTPERMTGWLMVLNWLWWNGTDDAGKAGQRRRLFLKTASRE